MKHNLKQTLALALTLLMLLALAIPAFADNTSDTVPTAVSKGTAAFTITIKKAEDNHKFTAYQIFEGAVATDNTLNDISWATGVKNTGTITVNGTATTMKDALIAAGLATDNGKTGSEKVDYDLSKAADVAKAMAAQSDDNDVMKKVADVFYAAKGGAAATADSKTGSDYVIGAGTSGGTLKPGYYLVVDEYKTAAADGAATLSRNILSVTGNVTADVKNDKPDITKKILDKGIAKDSNNTGIGDTVAFQITGAVPNYAGYDKYFYVMNDTLSNGLTFDGARNLVVTIDGNKLTEGNDYKVLTSTTTPAATTGHTFEVAFTHIKDYTIGKDIVVTYSATVNENAVIGNAGNPNTASLTYSNNPNDSSDGNPSTNPKPESDHPTGESLPDKTLTFVTELDITKYADSLTGAKLDGAQFVLSGTSTVTTAKTYDSFVEDPNGIYYKLTDNTYTTTIPHGDIKDADGNVKVASNESSYDSTTTRYSPTKTTEYKTEDKTVALTGTTAGGGKLSFKGLGAGTYTLTELKAPDGYNVAEPVTFTITATNIPTTVSTGNETCSWTSNNGAVTADSTGKLQTNVIDKKGNTLPSTGGVGTTVFYVLGSVLVVAAGVTLVTRKRLSDR